MRLRLLIALVVSLLPLLSASRPPAAQPRASFKSPLGVAIDATGDRAYVALHGTKTVAIIDLGAGKLLHEIALDRPPRDVVLAGESLCVAFADSAELTTIDPQTRKITGRVPRKAAPAAVVSRLEERQVTQVQTDFWLGPRVATNARAAATHDGILFVLHQRPRHHLPATQVAQGWVFTNALGALINVPPVLASLDEPQHGHADPSDLVISPDGKHLFIACAGADVVLVADRERLLKAGRVRELLQGYRDDHRESREDLTASRRYLVARLPTQANPRRLAISGDGKTLVVSNHLADSLTIIDAEKLQVVRHLSLNGPEPDAARRGEVLFHSARLTFQQQFTCASCHPHGGADGLTWDLERDGVGNFKRTKSLLGVKDTAPYGWHGTSATLADRVAGTLRTLHRHEPTPREVQDLVAYLESLPPPKAPEVKENERPAIERGRVLFHEKGRCSTCHHRAGMDDGKSHDVGTGGPTDTQSHFDTPGLRGVSRFGSYLHDGRALSLEEVFTEHNPKQRHGAAHLLSKEELADLIAYLKSL